MHIISTIYIYVNYRRGVGKMCGIMAVKGRGAVEYVIAGLKTLEYRGYDSAGVGIKEGNTITTIKALGSVDNLVAKGYKGECCDIAIGHTRWATHGDVTENNCHPHLSRDNNFCIVHNGIIENYKKLKDEYFDNMDFRSNTDSEIIAQLLSYFYEGDVLSSLKKTIDILEGSYAIVVISSYDNKLYFARKSSPLIISKEGKLWAIASDIKGCKCKREIYYVDDMCYGYIDNNVHVYDNKCRPTKVEWNDYSMLELTVNKGNFRHYMEKEIYDIPKALRLTYDSFLSSNITMPSIIKNVLVVGCGTSYHSGLIGKKYLEKVAGVSCECLIASEFVYDYYLKKENTLAVFISQSGETADTLLAIKKAKELGLFTLGITNVPCSTITHLCDAVLYINVGAEICVASTKAYTSQILMMLLLSNLIANINSRRSDGDGRDYGVYNCADLQDYLLIDKGDWQKLFDLNISQIERAVDDIILNIVGRNELHLIGKGYDYITAMEGALKIKEVGYIFTDAYPCGELKHGTLSLISDGSIVISIATSKGILWEKTLNAINEVLSRGGRCLVVENFVSENDCDRSLFDKFGDDCLRIHVPNINEWFSPILSIIPIDIIAYKLSCAKGINPDKPRNLAKSVTVE